MPQSLSIGINVVRTKPLLRFRKKRRNRNDEWLKRQEFDTIHRVTKPCSRDTSLLAQSERQRRLSFAKAGAALMLSTGIVMVLPIQGYSRLILSIVLALAVISIVSLTLKKISELRAKYIESKVGALGYALENLKLFRR